MKKIVISLVNYTNHDVTVSCLRSLMQIDTTGLKVHIIVVNNDTGKAFVFPDSGKPEIEIIASAENLGFAGGHNVSFKRAQELDADYTLILNNDTIVEKHFLQKLVTTAAEHNDNGIFGPLIYFAKGHEFHQDRYKKEEQGKVIWYAGGEIDWKNLILSHRGVDEVYRGQYTKTEKTAFVSGCCLLVPQKIARAIGGFSEKYFLYLEDTDYNMRVKKQGYGLYFVPDSVIWHENAGSTGGSGSSLQDYYITRNRLLFGFTYAPLRTKVALFRESLMTLKRGRIWQKRGVKDFYSGKFGKGSYSS